MTLVGGSCMMGLYSKRPLPYLARRKGSWLQAEARWAPRKEPVR